MQQLDSKQHDLGALSVLLIEDDSATREVLADLLNEIGITNIHPMPDAFQALHFIDSHPDWRGLVLCDWNMPKMSGAAFYRQVKNTHPNIPFIMVTGRNDEDSVLFAKDSGIYAYLLKPVSLGELERKVNKVINIRHTGFAALSALTEPSYTL